MSSRRPDALSEYYKVFSPYNLQLRFSDQFYRIAAEVECVKCGKRKTQILRAPRFKRIGPSEILVPRPDPTDTKVITSFMLRACDHLVGCFTNCQCGLNFGTGQPLRLCAKQCGKCSECIIPRCTCKRGCGNKGIYPCRCGWVAQNHKALCPVGAVKRTGSFALAHMRSQMVSMARRVS